MPHHLISTGVGLNLCKSGDVVTKMVRGFGIKKPNCHVEERMKLSWHALEGEIEKKTEN